MDSLRFDVQIKDIEKVNSLFSRCKILICYADLNRNNSVIPYSLINDKLHTLYNCPIVGEYSKVKEDFLDHGGKVVVNKDGELEYVTTTIPYGVVPESSDIKWEFIDGKEYLTCTGYLWGDRYPEVIDALENHSLPQSMEIANVVGDFNDNKQFVVSDFNFSGLCILGSDVEACFESASISLFTVESDEKNEFSQQFNLMVKELEDSLLNNQDNSNSDNQDNSLDFTNINNKENDVVKTKAEIATNFALTIMQLYDEMSRVIEQQTFIGENWWGEKCEMARYYMRDFDEAYVYVIDVQNDYIDVKLPYSKEGDDIKVDFDSPTRVKYTPTDWETQAVEGEEEMSFNYIKEYTEIAKSTVVEKVSEYDLKIKEHEDTVFAVENKYSELEKQFTSQKEIVNEKEKEIEQLNEKVQSFAQKEDEKAVDELLKNFTAILSEDEKLEFKTKRSEFDSIEKFEIHIKSFAFDKIKNQTKDENKSFITMALIDDVKEEKKELSHWDRMKEKSGK
ncbi:hypothetical protein [Paenibacillus tianjinensis]|uniref:Uncharacterized protein n=1 Tax=Paenibacillus tianjinensis TaxID=2810347 RepID=A0ABX7L5X2_9BACL|nr:hypothetical protein [Paenibacillus tianjinensis]QSF43530.1 hypothetical protein JRJ22_19915 [Paenibacillus tianjinensis]